MREDLYGLKLVGCKYHSYVWVKKPTGCHFCFILYFSFTSCSTCFGQPCAHLQELSCARTPQWTHYLLTGFDTVVLRTPQWTHYLLTGSDSLPAATAQYQHVAITLRSRQFLKIGTWLPETCWATCKGEIKDNTKWHLVGFLFHTE